MTEVDQVVVRYRPQRARVAKILVSHAVMAHQAPGWDEGCVVRSSGFVLWGGHDPLSVRCRYVHYEGTEVTEGEYHDRIRRILDRAGYETEQIDAPACANVGVRVTGIRLLEAEDHRLLDALARGRLRLAGGRWHDDSRPGRPLAHTTPVRDYVLGGLVELGPDQVGRLTPAGWELYRRATQGTVPAVDLSEYG
ncbi:hypothetical protein ACIF6L_34990 [Kitasatospora sp. NPDC086009]|uniref:hypothetical protein n=1 Tax=unclassified Kitasatospora TaxID=2633591 RepID=UPI0037CA0CA2